MSRHSDGSRFALVLLGFAALQALAVGALLAPAAGSAPASAKPAQTANANASAPRPILPDAELDPLRDEATLGDPVAGSLLVAQLLDRYERTSDSDDLFEAVQWIDRGWRAGEYQQSALASRVSERHCSHKVLRWHWLCDRGE